MPHHFSVKVGQLLLFVLFLLIAFSAESQAAASPTAVPTHTATLNHHIFLPLAAHNSSGGGNQPPGDLQIYAYSDAAVIHPNQMIQPLLVAQKPLICQAKAAPQMLTLPQALQNGWNYLTQRVGAANLSAFRSAADLDTPAKAQAFALAALADNRPDGALAALLHAHTLDPQSPIILVNAAGIFVTLNKPNEALALLDAAAALPGPMATPMGIPGEELAANTRGYALLLLARWAEAEAVLRPLAESDTELSEARLNLSQALLCQNKDNEAMRFYRLGSRRMMWDVAEYGEEVEGIRPPVELTLNRSAGKLFTLPPLGVMHTPQQAEAVWQHLNELIDESIARTAAINAQIQINSELRSERPLPGPLTFARFNNITITALRAQHEPDIQALYQATADQDTALTELNNQQAIEWLELADMFPDWNAYTAACRSLVTGHLSVWLTEYYQFESLLEQYTTAKYAAMTGTAANLADPLFHEYVSLRIEHEMEGDVAWRLHTLNRYAATVSARWGYCEGVEETAQAQASEPTFTRAAQCPAALTRNKMGIGLIPGILQLRLNCEVLEVEANTPGWLSIFGQVSVDFRNKTSTFFAGGKISSPSGMAQLGINEGFYVSVGENGIKDLGMKVSSSVDVGMDQFVGVIDGPGMEFGVTAAVEYWTGGAMP